MDFMKVKDDLNKKLERIRSIEEQIKDELLKPGKLTKMQENQILKLRQERYRERSNYYGMMEKLTNNNKIRQECNKIIEKCKNNECKTYYLIQSKKR